MSYQFIKSVCLPKDTGSEWAVIDIQNMSIASVFDNYIKVYLELSNHVLATNVYVDLDVLKNRYLNFTGTIVQLLILLGDTSLTTTPKLPTKNAFSVKYMDAIRAEYKVNTCVAGSNIPNNYPELNKHDLEVVRNKYATDSTLVHKYCMVSVNGFYHLTAADDTATYVYKGADTMRRSKDNHLGILSFLDIGKLTKVPLIDSYITPQVANDPLKTKITITVPDELDNKSYMLSLGGYLVMPEVGVFWRSGTSTFTLDITKIPYIERLYESSLYMNLDELNLSINPINQSMINVEEAYSDTVLRKYLKMSQTFLVIVDIPYLTTGKVSIRRSNMPGMFISYIQPKLPLIVSHGKTAEYWSTFEDGQWSVTVADSFLRNFILSKQPLGTDYNITGNLTAQEPFRHSLGYFLNIIGYNL